MRVFLIILIASITGAVGWYLGTTYRSGQTGGTSANHSNEPSASMAGNVIRCQGKLQPASGLLRIVAPPGERISQLTEKQIGDQVESGEVLAVLESRLLREKDLALAEARRDDAIEMAELEKEQGQYKLQSAELALSEADAAADRIQSEAKKIELIQRQSASASQLLKRLQEMQSNPVTATLVNQTDIDKQTLLVEQLVIQVEQARLELDLSKKSSQRARELAKNNLATVRSSLKNADKATPLKTLEAAVALAQQALDMTKLKSPVDRATILDIIVRKGDSVTNQPIMILGDTSEMVCVAEVNDLFLQKIDPHKNLKATLRSAAFDGPLTGTVIEKGVMVGPPSLEDPNPFARVDRRTGSVTIKLNDPETAAKYVNLQVDVEIELSQSTSD